MLFATLIEQPRQQARGNRAFGIRHAVHVAARAAMHEQAARHIHFNDGDLVARGRRQPKAIHHHMLQGWFDGIHADVADTPHHRIETLQGYADDLLRVVRHAEDQDATLAVRKRRKPVGKRVIVRPFDLTGKSDFFELQIGALAEANLLHQLRFGVKHRTFRSSERHLGNKPR